MPPYLNLEFGSGVVLTLFNPVFCQVKQHFAQGNCEESAGHVEDQKNHKRYDNLLIISYIRKYVTIMIYDIMSSCKSCKFAQCIQKLKLQVISFSCKFHYSTVDWQFEI